MVIVRLQEKGLLYSDITEVFISKKLLVQILSVVVETSQPSALTSPHRRWKNEHSEQGRADRNEKRTWERVNERQEGRHTDCTRNNTNRKLVSTAKETTSLHSVTTFIPVSPHFLCLSVFFKINKMFKETIRSTWLNHFTYDKKLHLV